MKELTKKQKIFVLKSMIWYYSSVEKISTTTAVCKLAGDICRKDLRIEDLSDLSEVREILMPEIEENTPDDNEHYPYWWDTTDPKPRLKYCKKILKLIESK
jgi:hypothetical protein